VTTRLVVVRHAEPTRWARGRAIGRTDVGLSRRGARQARELAAHFVSRHVARVVSSPLARARLTAGPIARACGPTLEVDPDLREIDFGELDGRTFGWIERHHPRLFEAWMRDPTAVAFPGGESWSVVGPRVLAALDRIAAGGEDRLTVVVGHLSTALAALARAEGARGAPAFSRSVPHAEPIALEVRSGGWTFVPTDTARSTSP
jgi:broad specificity phosphatase PhoE